jgi:hypothetical protein
MTLALDLNTIASMVVVGLAGWMASSVWKLSAVVARLDERTKAHGDRLDSLEGRAGCA